MISLEAIYLQIAFSQPDLFSIQVKYKGDSIYKVIARDTHGSKLYKYTFRSNMEIATGFIAAGAVSEFLSRDAKDLRAYCGRMTVLPLSLDRTQVAFEGNSNALCQQNSSGYWDHNHYDYLREKNNTPIPCSPMITAEAFNNNSPTLQVANILKDSGTSTDTDIESGSDEDVFYRVNKPHEKFTPTDIHNSLIRVHKDIDTKLIVLAELCEKIAETIMFTGKTTHTSIDTLVESVFNSNREVRQRIIENNTVRIGIIQSMIQSLEKKIMEKFENPLFIKGHNGDSIEVATLDTGNPLPVEGIQNASWTEDSRPIKEQMESATQKVLNDTGYVPTQRFPCDHPLRPILNANGFYLRPLCYVDFVSDSLEKIVIPEAVCFSDTNREDIYDICNDFKEQFKFDPNCTDVQSLEWFLSKYRDRISQPEVSKILCLSPYDSDELNHEGISWYLLSRWNDVTYIGHRGIEFNYALVIDSINSPKSKQLIRDGQMIDPFLFPEKPAGFSEGPEDSGESLEDSKQ